MIVKYVFVDLVHRVLLKLKQKKQQSTLKNHSITTRLYTVTSHFLRNHHKNVRVLIFLRLQIKFHKWKFVGTHL